MMNHKVAVEAPFLNIQSKPISIYIKADELIGDDDSESVNGTIER